jgi:hypothetical protein
VSIVDAVADAKLFKPLFKDLETWKAWSVWQKAVFALPMAAEELELYRQCTGREQPPTQEATEVFTICGRRSGKSFQAALVAVYLAFFGKYSQFLGRVLKLLITRVRREYRTRSDSQRGQSQYRA